jgi:hypothetical protein
LARRLLLSDAVDSAAVFGDGIDAQLHYSAIRESIGDDLAGGFIASKRHKAAYEPPPVPHRRLNEPTVSLPREPSWAPLSVPRYSNGWKVVEQDFTNQHSESKDLQDVAFGMIVERTVLIWAWERTP